MKVVIDNVKDKKDVKVGDLIKYTESSTTYMIVELGSGYSWLDLNSGHVKDKKFDSIQDLLEREFLCDESIDVFSSQYYSLKLIEN